LTGRHRAPSPSARRAGTAAVGALGATALVLPVAPAVATAETPDPAAVSPAAVSPAAASPAGASPAGAHRSDDSQEGRGARVVHAASKEWGHPYVYGGDGPLVFDCSGLTKYVYRKFGVSLPHNAAAQYQVVDHVSKSDMRLGDLVFFYDDSGIYHVGIYAGGDQMWAASHTGDYVRKQAIYTDRFVVGRP
jgi:cell wall-associated NlpC family hydrolase